jgi:hypothetical protein
VIVLNSFSKYWLMTGWRLGWLLAPEALMPAIDRLAQNIFLSAPTVAQHAALAALAPATRPLLEQRKAELRERRDWLLPALEGLGFRVGAVPEGAFYVYAGIDAFGMEAEAFWRRNCCWKPGWPSPRGRTSAPTAPTGMFASPTPPPWSGSGRRWGEWPASCSLWSLRLTCGGAGRPGSPAPVGARPGCRVLEW